MEKLLSSYQKALISKEKLELTKTSLEEKLRDHLAEIEPQLQAIKEKLSKLTKERDECKQKCDELDAKLNKFSNLLLVFIYSCLVLGIAIPFICVFISLYFSAFLLFISLISLSFALAFKGEKICEKYKVNLLKNNPDYSISKSQYETLVSKIAGLEEAQKTLLKKTRIISGQIAYLELQISRVNSDIKDLQPMVDPNTWWKENCAHLLSEDEESFQKQIEYK